MGALVSKRCRNTGIIVSCIFGLVLGLPTISSAYTGSLSSASGEVKATGNWGDPGPTTIEWVVTQNGDHWTYSYTLTHPRGDTSHFILEVSASFTEADLQNASGDFTSTVLGDWSPGPGNPHMPGDIHGIKFDGAWGVVTRITFDSPRSPVWGDFYAKDGAATGFNTAWNEGFYSDDPQSPIDTDPSDPPSDGSIDNHILVPDTVPVQTEACCFPDGRCELLVEGDCIAQGGTPRGEGTNCEPNECPQPPPFGGCCFPDGRCEVLTEAECDQVGGIWNAGDTDCEPNECPQPPPLGACCFPDGSCQVLTEDQCFQGGGNELLEGETCDEPSPCLPVASERSTWGRIKSTFR